MSWVKRVVRETWIGKRLATVAKRRAVLDYTEYLREPTGERALVAYLAWPLLPPPRLRNRIEFSNRGIAQEIPRALNALGYVVDIVNFDNDKWVPSRSYDLVVGHGANFARIAALVGPKPVKIYFATGAYWREANLRAAERLYRLAERTGHLLPPERAVSGDEEAANRAADGIICLGNRRAAETFAAFGVVECINNAAFPVDEDERYLQKDFEAARRAFLFFSGPGNVHKGLDRLLEAFEGTDLSLHVCQSISADFRRVYRAHLQDLPNVVVHGVVPMRSERFRALVASCGWVIHPTASEGQPGSVIECMAHGLVPIVSAEANMDVDGYGWQLPDCSVETLRSIIRAAANAPPGELRARAEATLNVVRSAHTPEAFRSAFQRAVISVLERSRGGMA